MAAGVAALLMLAACSGSAPKLAGNVPSPIGDAVEVAAQDGWRLLAQQSQFGQCLELAANDESELACGFEVPERHDVSYFAAQLGSDRFLAGPVVADAATVRVELVDRDPLDVPVIEAEIGTYVYVVRVPGGLCARVVALDSDGGELDSVEMPEDPWAS